jgi:hypothetical protein
MKSNLKLIYAGYTGSKNPVYRTWFFQLDLKKIKCRSTGGVMPSDGTGFCF